MAGQAISANEVANPEIEFARPRICHRARLVDERIPRRSQDGLPTPNRPTKANKITIRQPGPSDDFGDPRSAQDTTKIKPTTARAELRRCRRTSRNTSIWMATMTPV